MHVGSESVMQQFIEFASNHPILVGSFLGLLGLLLFTESRKSGRKITSAQLTVEVNQNKGVVVDVRERKQFVLGHIVDSINIPLKELEKQQAQLEKYRERPIVLVDELGQQSMTAVRQLNLAGFKQVMRLAGGLNQWQSDGLPLVKS